MLTRNSIDFDPLMLDTDNRPPLTVNHLKGLNFPNDSCYAYDAIDDDAAEVYSI